MFDDRKVGINIIVPKYDLTGQTYGRLTVLRQAEDIVYNNHHYTAWWCKCSCGNPNEVLARGKDLKDGFKQSCGCLPRERLKKYNEYDLSGDFGRGWTNKGEEFWFDKDDYDLIKDYCWHTASNGYFIAKFGKKHITISRLIMGVLDEDWTEIVVDHINGNIMDNRRGNLRIGTPSNNSMNSSKNKNNTSGVVGVYKIQRTGKWKSKIILNRKQIDLGNFDNFDDAVAARKAAEEKYFGEWSYDNSRGVKKEGSANDIQENVQ